MTLKNAKASFDEYLKQDDYFELNNSARMDKVHLRQQRKHERKSLVAEIFNTLDVYDVWHSCECNFV